MNTSDASKAIAAIHEVIKRHPNNAVIAFDSVVITSQLSNVRYGTNSQRKLLDDLNDELAATTVCRKLGGIFTVCEYEFRTWFLIRADLAVTDSEVLFDPASKRM